jgi:hypothetical protein
VWLWQAELALLRPLLLLLLVCLGSRLLPGAALLLHQLRLLQALPLMVPLRLLQALLLTQPPLPALLVAPLLRMLLGLLARGPLLLLLQLGPLQAAA